MHQAPVVKKLKANPRKLVAAIVRLRAVVVAPESARKQANRRLMALPGVGNEAKDQARLIIYLIIILGLVMKICSYGC